VVSQVEEELTHHGHGDQRDDEHGDGNDGADPLGTPEAGIAAAFMAPDLQLGVVVQIQSLRWRWIERDLGLSSLVRCRILFGLGGLLGLAPGIGDPEGSGIGGGVSGGHA